MSDYVLSCCSTADLSKEHFESRNIRYICFHYTLDGENHLDDLGQSIPFEEFYAAMENGADTRTSQINVDEYVEYFDSILSTGADLIHLTLSSGISGSINSARSAAEIVAEKYPDRKIYIVDSLAASSGYGLIMDKMADLRDGGMGIDELYNWVEQNKLRMHHWFFSTDLKYYIKGGRISKTSGTIGTLLGICPLLNVDHEGKLIPRAKVRTKKKVMREIVERMVQHAQDGLDYSDKCYMSQSACVDDARIVAEDIKSRFKKIKGDIEINYIGTVIGSHSGPGTVAVFFWGDPRED